MSSTRHCIACSWTLMCTTWTYSMTCLSSWPVTSCIAFFLFIVFLGIKFNRMVRRRGLKQRVSRLSHYRGPHGKPCRRDGTLASRWASYVKMKGLVFLLLYTQTSAMDAAQATSLLGRIMGLSTAATTAVNTANQMLEAYSAGGGKGSQTSRFGDGTKLLRSPEVFDTDDPVKYTNWREQFLNWLTFCDGRHSDLIKDLASFEAALRPKSSTSSIGHWPGHYAASQLSSTEIHAGELAAI